MVTEIRALAKLSPEVIRCSNHYHADESILFRVSGATLIFDVELMGINQAPPPQNVFKQIDIDDDNQLSKEEVRFMSTWISLASTNASLSCNTKLKLSSVQFACLLIAKSLLFKGGGLH